MTQNINKRLNEIVNKKLKEFDDFYDSENDEDNKKLLKLKTCKHPGCENLFPINYKDRNRRFCRTHIEKKDRKRLIEKRSLIKKLREDRKVIQNIVISNSFKEDLMNKEATTKEAIKEKVETNEITDETEVKSKKKRTYKKREKVEYKKKVKTSPDKKPNRIGINDVFVGCKGVDDYCAKYEVNFFIGSIIKNAVCLENQGKDDVYYLNEIIHYAQKEKERRTTHT